MTCRGPAKANRARQGTIGPVGPEPKLGPGPFGPNFFLIFWMARGLGFRAQCLSWGRGNLCKIDMAMRLQMRGACDLRNSGNGPKRELQRERPKMGTPQKASLILVFPLSSPLSLLPFVNLFPDCVYDEARLAVRKPSLHSIVQGQLGDVTMLHLRDGAQIRFREGRPGTGSRQSNAGNSGP